MSALEELIARVEAAQAALRTARVLFESSGHWCNAAGYRTDAALWVERALWELAEALEAQPIRHDARDGASPKTPDPESQQETLKR